MSQTKNKLSIPELISIGVFTALYFVLVTIATFTSNVIFPGFSNVFLPGIAALLSGCVFMLMVAKVPHFGAITVMGTVMGLFLFVSGHFAVSLVIGNLLLFFHADLATEMCLMCFFLLPFAFSKKWKTGLRLTLMYVVLLAMDFWFVPVARGAAASWISLLSVGIRMMFPCLVTGIYAFTTTGVSEFVCAMRKMKIPENIIIPCTVVIRFFPTIREDYRQIRSAMKFCGNGQTSVILHPMRNLEYVLIPLLMNSNNVSQDLSVAALTKGIGMEGEHTSISEMHFGALDIAYMTLCTVPLILYLI